MAVSERQTVKDYFQAFCIALYMTRNTIFALVITIGTWLLFASLVPTKYVDLVAYGITGYYWLGAVVAPWVEQKLEQLFG